MEVGDRVHLKMNLHWHDSHLERGAAGRIRGFHTDKVDVSFGSVRCLCDPSWLEPSPGTNSIGLQTICRRQYKFYQCGPLVSDLRFPTEEELAHRRFSEHQQRLMKSNFGFSFYDGIDATAILDTFHRIYGTASYLQPLGLVVAEHLWVRGAGDRMGQLVKLVVSFLSQLPLIPKIIIMRVSDWKWVQARLRVHSRRLEVLNGSDFQPHYEPLRHCWTSLERDVIRAPELAIVIHPTQGRFNYHTPLHVPQAVLSAMFKDEKTLWCAAGTLESQVSALEWFLEKLREHNIAPP